MQTEILEKTIDISAPKFHGAPVAAMAERVSRERRPEMQWHNSEFGSPAYAAFSVVRDDVAVTDLYDTHSCYVEELDIYDAPVMPSEFAME